MSSPLRSCEEDEGMVVNSEGGDFDEEDDDGDLDENASDINSPAAPRETATPAAPGTLGSGPAAMPCQTNRLVSGFPSRTVTPSRPLAAVTEVVTVPVRGNSRAGKESRSSSPRRRPRRVGL
ncbi:chromodomain-helicase-DNA-binding protein 3-like isoform X1 [Lates japonicus]|uniref:Chromodomain-helicase-DNA-binding protein 3-like isoform X1 n=1 Tax=Lates japonicus TaxID=270547 RepID=A0AAD3MGF9_LATJO|nr:chromodomain-helicase-DNA-binding protein 3-like isoform X1 [Lates japonicus]